MIALITAAFLTLTYGFPTFHTMQGISILVKI
jgi:hypothetical protein